MLCFNHLHPTVVCSVGLSKNSSDRSNVENSGGYSVAMSTNGNIVPQLTTFYQTPKPTVLSVAPYATTTLIGVTGCNERSSLSRKKIKRNNADILHHSAASGNGNFTYVSCWYRVMQTLAGQCCPMLTMTGSGTTNGFAGCCASALPS